MKAHPTLLVAVDFSEPSKRALAKAIELARDLGGELHIVHALEPPPPVFTAYSFQLPEPFFEAARAEARRLLEEMTKQAADAGVDATGHLATPPPGTGIADAAVELGADLLILGTHGHTGLKHVALGSVAERTIRHAPCNVLVVKTREEADAADLPAAS